MSKPRAEKTATGFGILACLRMWGLDSPASQEDAIDQVRHKAARLGANAITNVTCDSSEGMTLSKNCWSAFTCRADAINVPTP